jgi:hypothetical protein
MDQHSTFKGKVSVRHAAVGYSVRFDPGTETDPHDLGHALAAVITSYIDRYGREAPKHLQMSVGELEALVIEGIQCGLEHNPKPLQTN